MARVESASLFADDDFAWEEPGFVAAAGAVTVEIAAPAPVRRRRPRQTRTLAGDLARLEQALGLSPVALLAILLVLVAAAAGIRILVSDDGPASAPKTTSPTRAAQSPTPGIRETPVDESAATPKTFEKGDAGAGVRDLQAALSALGFYSGALDGGYGPGTQSAVSAFQSERGLTADGVAGPQTAAALSELAGERGRADAETATAGLASAVAAGRLKEGEAAGYRTVLADSLTAIERLSAGRGATIGLVLHDVAANATEYDGPRALALFGMLQANVAHLAENKLPAGMADVVGEDGTVYRYFKARGFQFHPLANFAHLTKLVKQGRNEDVRRLSTALSRRAVPVGKSLTWEYYFPFGGPTRWTSGLAQAAGAQALARAGALLGDPEVSRLARGAYRSIPSKLMLELGGGLWIREYGYSDMAILNAQLQSLISISDYATITGDSAAAAVASRMSTAAETLLPQFDTGCWSLYALDGSPASDTYHRYHVWLLEKLSADTGKPIWTVAAARWAGYLRAGGCA